jgi:hypothetical protein
MMYDYEEVKHEFCNTYTVWGLSYSESVIAGCVLEDEISNAKKYRDQLNNYLRVGQVGIKTTETCGYGRIFTLVQFEAIKKEIQLLNIYLG